MTERKQVPLSFGQIAEGVLEIRVHSRCLENGVHVRVFRDGCGRCLGAAGPATDLIETREADAAEKPGTQRPAVSFDRWCRLDKLKERLLDSVLCGLAVGKHRER